MFLSEHLWLQNILQCRQDDDSDFILSQVSKSSPLMDLKSQTESSVLDIWPAYSPDLPLIWND